ncbi:MAG: gliding motility-associated C-terminal domain-containing protein, partial [Saprospiraceae bacterium]
PIPVVALSEPEGCAPIEIDFGVEVPGNLPLEYVWDFGDGVFGFEQNLSHPYNIPGEYLVKVVVSTQTDSICRDSVEELIIIHEPVMISDSIMDVLCYSANTGVIDIEVISGTAPFQYTWSQDSVTQDIDELFAGTYGLTILDVNSCTYIDDFTVDESPQILVTTIDSSIVTCYGGDDGGLCVEVNGGLADYQIQWEDGTVDNCLENVAADTYLLQITDANNCMVDTLLQVYENPLITIRDTAINISCFGENDGIIRLDSIWGGASSIYNNTLTGPVSYEEGGTAFQNLVPGEYQLMVMDLEGCSFEKLYIIGEPDSLWMEMEEDSIPLLMGDSAQIKINHNAVDPTFSWSPINEYLRCWDCEEPFVSPLRTTTYYVDLINGDGCEVRDQATVFVDLNKEFYVPNTFTPNGDGRNDLFRIRSVINSIKQVTVFRVFDRWGELLFERKNFRPQEENIEDAWNGTFKGQRLPPDVFTYYLEIEYVDEEKEQVKGTITLIR